MTSTTSTFKRGDEIEVWGCDLDGADTWEPGTIVRRERQGIGETAEWYIVRYADGGSLCIHAERMRLRAAVTVGDLADGDEFSLDGGKTWHTCAVVLFGNVAVYADERRDDDAPTVRIDAPRDALVVVR